MHFKRDFSNGQFVELRAKYQAAESCLKKLMESYPEYKDIWENVRNSMNTIKKTIDLDEVPSDDQKRAADISTMLNYELRDFSDSNAILPLYQLDNAYALLGMKDIKFNF